MSYVTNRTLEICSSNTMFFTIFDVNFGLLCSITYNDSVLVVLSSAVYMYTVFQKKTSTHIIGYKLRNSCPILIIFDTKIPHII